MANIFFDEAKEHKSHGDQEMEYVCLRKFMVIINSIETEEYKPYKSKFREIFGINNISMAIENIAKLRTTLIKR